MNHAARQEIFRLPNGKLIQVRKQTNQPNQPPRPAGVAMAMPRTQFTIRPSQPLVNTPSARMIRPGLQLQNARALLNQQPMRRPSPYQNQQNQQQQQQRANANAAPASTAIASTVFTQQNGSISVARAPQPDTPYGKAKTGFEDKIISGLEICQHTINKMITLTNSTSFKSSRNFADLKELYIHLQYLFTYTSGKIKTLQDSLVTGMEELTKQDASSKEKNEDGELEIVEQKQVIVEVLSDDEEEAAAAAVVASKAKVKSICTKSTSQPINRPSSIASTSSSLTADKRSEIEEENLDLQRALMSNLVNSMQNSISQFIPRPTEADLLETFAKDDKTLTKKTLVKVERLEDSKSSLIKQYMIAIQQRRDRSESRENSPDPNDGDFPFMPEVVMQMEEGDGEIAQNEHKSDEEEVTTETTAEKSVEVVVEIASDEETVESEKTAVNKSDDDDKNDEHDENKEELKVVPEEEEEEVQVHPEAEANEKENEEKEEETEVETKTDDENSIEAPTVELAMEVDESINENNEADESQFENSILTISTTESIQEKPEIIVNGDESSLTDVSMVDENDITDIVENTIDDEKDLLDNLINSLDESEPLTSIELENFP